MAGLAPMIVDERPAAIAPARRPLGWRALGGIAAAETVLLIAFAGRYGYHSDELYFRALGEHPQWSYADQPALVPLLARAETLLFGDTLWGLRVLPALLAGVTVLLAGLLARELGGGRAAQYLASAATAVSASTLAYGHILSPGSVDIPVWLALCWATIRLIRTRDERIWLLAGALAGIGMLAKHLVVLLLGSLLTGLLVGRAAVPWRSRFLAYGLVLAVLGAAPAVLWQAAHGWPQFTMVGALAGEDPTSVRISFLPGQILILGPFVAPLWIAGVVGLVSRPRWRPYRPLVVAYGVAVVVLLALAGQPRYTIGVVLALLSAGAVVVTDWARTMPRRVLAGALVVANLVLSALMTLPLLPAARYTGGGLLAGLAGDYQLQQTGWPGFADRIAAVHRGLSPADQAADAVLTRNYAQAGALQRYGPAAGAPAVYSGHNSYHDAGPPPEGTRVVIAVGLPAAVLRRHFAGCTPAAAIPTDNPWQRADVQVCRDPRQPWTAIWPRLRVIGGDPVTTP